MRLFSNLAATLFIVGALSPFAAPAAQAQGPLCQPDATHLCFQGRFEVAIAYQPGPTSPIAARAVQPTGNRPGYFVFADLNTAEDWLEVVDGCPINGHYWVRSLNVSPFGWQITVTDRPTGNQKTYVSPAFVLDDPIQDIQAFACGTLQTPPSGLAGAPLPRSMDLHGGRFRMKATYAGPPVVEAGAVQVTRDSGVFSVFGGGIQDVLVKISKSPDGTNAAVTASIGQSNMLLEVTDLCTGNQFSHSNVDPESFAIVAFKGIDDSCGLFYDGFESGFIAAWSATPVP